MAQIWHRSFRYARRLQGREEVANFFSQVAGTLEITRFEVVKMLAQDNTVMVQLATTGKAIATGRDFESSLIHIFEFDSGGKVAKLELYPSHSEELYT